jgi:hypothetical protein
MSCWATASTALTHRATHSRSKVGQMKGLALRKTHGLTSRNCDFTMENGDFTINKWDFTMERFDLTKHNWH